MPNGVTILDQVRHALAAGPAGLFFAGPAVGADLAAVQTDGFQQTVQSLIAQGVEAHLVTDGFQQALTALGFGIGILSSMLLADFALQTLDGLAGQQFHLGVGAGEV